jgi:hypothetical protein
MKTIEKKLVEFSINSTHQIFSFISLRFTFSFLNLYFAFNITVLLDHVIC